MLDAMPDERVRNEVPGTVHGTVSQVGIVHGGLHIHSAQGRSEPFVDLAARIANSIADTGKKTDALLDVAAEIIQADLERAEQVLALIPGPTTIAQAKVILAAEITERDPEFASRLVEPIVDEPSLDKSIDGDLRLHALVICLQGRVPPDRAALLVSEAEKRPQCDAYSLAAMASARHSDDPLDSARLADLAERAALTITDQGRRDRALREVANEVATIDLRRAIEVLKKVSTAYWTSNHISPDEFVNAAGFHRDYALTVFDHYFRALRSFGNEVDPRRQDLAIAVAGLDIYRADSVAFRITTATPRVSALTGMARKAAATDRDQAQIWLMEAMDVALAQAAISTQWWWQSKDLLGEVAAAAADLDAVLRRQAVRLITDEMNDQRPAAEVWRFADILKQADPVRAEQLAKRAFAMDHDLEHARRLFHAIADSCAESDPVKALRTLDLVEIDPDDDWQRIAHAELLIKIATNLAVWDPAEAKTVLNRAQRELRAIRSASYSGRQAWESLATALVQLDPGVLERLATQMSGKDDVLAAMAVGVVKASASRTA